MVRDFVRKNKQAMGKRLNVRTFTISILFPHSHLYGQCLYSFIQKKDVLHECVHVPCDVTCIVYENPPTPS